MQQRLLSEEVLTFKKPFDLAVRMESVIVVGANITQASADSERKTVDSVGRKDT